MAIFRVAYFAFDRLQEPLSRSIEVLARQSPTFNRGCATLARNFEKWRVSSLNRDLAVGEKRLLEARLTQEEAVHKGAALLGESILWITGSAVVLHQYLREKEDENEVAAAEQERNFYYQKLRDLEVFLDHACDTIGGGEHTAVAAHQIRSILYAGNDVFVVRTYFIYLNQTLSLSFLIMLHLRSLYPDYSGLVASCYRPKICK